MISMEALAVYELNSGKKQDIYSIAHVILQKRKTENTDPNQASFSEDLFWSLHS
jgi:hypothetical protein